MLESVIRRIVMGQGPQGRSVVIEDGTTPALVGSAVIAAETLDRGVYKVAPRLTTPGTTTG
jgi:hypothetical protein